MPDVVQETGLDLVRLEMTRTLTGNSAEERLRMLTIARKRIEDWTATRKAESK